jgi:hypothetical protein
MQASDINDKKKRKVLQPVLGHASVLFARAMHSVDKRLHAPHVHHEQTRRLSDMDRTHTSEKARAIEELKLSLESERDVLVRNLRDKFKTEKADALKQLRFDAERSSSERIRLLEQEHLTDMVAREDHWWTGGLAVVGVTAVVVCWCCCFWLAVAHGTGAFVLSEEFMFKWSDHHVTRRAHASGGGNA